VAGRRKGELAGIVGVGFFFSEFGQLRPLVSGLHFSILTKYSTSAHVVAEDVVYRPRNT
jgi:hypothetical protein